MNYEYFWDDNDIAAITWLCYQQGTFSIDHTENSFTQLRKEWRYGALRGIIKNKMGLPCKVKIEERIGELVYHSKYIKIYKLDEKHEEIVSKKIDQNITKKSLNEIEQSYEESLIK